MKFIKKFEQLSMEDVALVGGKNASLGQMIVGLRGKGISIPTGFAITTDGYWHYLESNKIIQTIKNSMATIKDVDDTAQLQKVSQSIRSLIEQGTMPEDLQQEIMQAYLELSQVYGQTACDVAVRSSATAEDLPNASFAGQQESYLNVHKDELMVSYQKCIASLFTSRSIAYRIEQGLDHLRVGLSVGVQKMIRSDLACSGVAFSLDTETGFKDVVMINGSWGLGESIVQGLVIPDEFIVHKPTLKKGFASIIRKKLGQKESKIVYTDNFQDPTKTVPTTPKEQHEFTLNDGEILELARMVATIEDYYSDLKKSWCPMDIEWAKDGQDNKLYIIQARPETIHSNDVHNSITTYQLQQSDALKKMITGQSIGQQIVSGIARVITSPKDIDQVQKGDILVTQMTDPDWVPIMKKASAIITDRGGRTCHAAIVSRELGIPAIIGTDNATTVIKTGDKVTIDCSQGKTGFVYEGEIPFKKNIIQMSSLPTLPIELMVNIADPDSAFAVALLPTDGVGLARMEFIISNSIKIHPMALVHPEKVTDPAVQKMINDITIGYKDKSQFFIDTLAQGIGMIAAAFYPRPVIVRLSDFKTNEYRNLIGGSFFEPQEENPMLGFRGASRYYNDRYKEGFALECAALKKVREGMGLDNVIIMVPFVRTVGEAHKVLEAMAANDLKRGQNNLKIYMMCEIPSNVILIDEFSKCFDGLSIGSNDLTQLTLGVDRDSDILSKLFDERDPAVLKILKKAVEGAKRNGIHCGICGQAPSDFPEIAQFLIDAGIDSISLNSDTVLPFIERYKR
ncbi:MAG: phosphoenolpyruvate synthase [Candidatus Babeliales bacterium]|nr:phosphoenolpyruvate synthase [Candidatus Babeliales bacterium]